jgi:hypothetical protein
MDGERHGLPGTRERRRIEFDVERMRVAIDGEPGDADRAARHALGANVERTMGECDGIGPRPPVGADREGNDIVAGDEIDVDEALNSVADQRDRRLAGEG